MEATIEYHGDTWTIKAGMTVRSAIEKLGINPLLVLAVKNKKLINEQTLIEPDDFIKLVNVVSGG